ncbi:MAG: DUF615 domain-containing protein [Gammaproteobacteria bacterium]|nr:DUF615 domain-containing protein [Gammaproteobacteria bacterium]
MSENDTHRDAPSKSQLKRESTALQKLGEQLVSMPESQFLAIPMPEELRAAVKDARTMTSRRALYRQRQFIGKLMREIDASGVQAALEQQAAEHRNSARRFHHLENWRDRLIAEGDELLGELLEVWPEVDRQRVRNLVRQARFERDHDKPPASARSLFRYLKTLPPAGRGEDAEGE